MITHPATLTSVAVIGILAIVTIMVSTSINMTLKDLWAYIETQQPPEWFDPKLLPVLNSKIQEKMNVSVNRLNFMYAYACERGRFGDCSWAHVEDLVRLAVCRIPEDQKFDIVVGIKSGGAFIANFVSRCVGNLPVDYMKIQKYGQVTENMERFKLWMGKGNTSKLTEKPQADLRGKRVLICDDQCATGHTLERAVKCVEDMGAALVKSLTLTSLVKPSKADYYAYDGFILAWPWGVDA